MSVQDAAEGPQRTCDGVLRSRFGKMGRIAAMPQHVIIRNRRPLPCASTHRPSASRACACCMPVPSHPLHVFRAARALCGRRPRADLVGSGELVCKCSRTLRRAPLRRVFPRWAASWRASCLPSRACEDPLRSWSGGGQQPTAAAELGSYSCQAEGWTGGAPLVGRAMAMECVLQEAAGTGHQGPVGA